MTDYPVGIGGGAKLPPKEEVERQLREHGYVVIEHYELFEVSLVRHPVDPLCVIKRP